MVIRCAGNENSVRKHILANRIMLYDYLILGAGPAGLQLGYYLERAGYGYRILERGDSAGTFFKQFPRHRTLISINKVYTGCNDPERNMRWDWNSLLTDDYGFLFKDYSKEYFPGADAMVDYLRGFAAKYVPSIRYDTDIIRISRDKEGFHAETTTGETFSGRRIIIATGVGKPWSPAIPGIEMAEQYSSVSIDSLDFADQRVLILGKGNSSFETADHLTGHAATIHVAGPELLKFAWQTHYVGHLRAINNNFINTYLLKSQNGILDATVEKIEREGNGFRATVIYHRAGGSRSSYYYDRVICCTGFQIDENIFGKGCQPEMDPETDNRFPRQNAVWESTNIPDMYFAGTLTQQRDFKKTTSGFIHGFRYNARALFHYLAHEYHDAPWPHDDIQRREIAPAIIRLINRNSALWQQFGFLGDVFLLESEAGAAHYEAVPLDYIHDGGLVGDKPYFTVTLEYGHQEFDTLYDDRVSEHDADNAADSSALHPIIRLCRKGEVLAEQHLVENLEAIWEDPQLHIEPLDQFIGSIDLSGASA
uniref:Pyridine nucleotide-disulphide oxidoreductase n=1 Tax=Candidatus Kentrum sp. UNK TaxID=2126344 RepID=A0A451ANV4_9GAMM|nr:MAG: Pyridine nucleotide-disulphide oxidoreductase [Candidatus Kentron sp. UNK]